MSFKVNVLNSLNQRMGPGPLEAVATLNDTAKLDEINTASFTMPAGSKSAALITAGVKFDLFDPLGDGFLGRFYYSSRRMGQMLAIKCLGEAVELTRQTAGFRRSYDNVSVTSVVNDLLGIVSGWTGDIETAFDSINTVMTLEGESPYRGLDELRERFAHFRFARGQRLEFGEFGQTSGVTLKNLTGQISSNLADEVAIIKDGSVTMLEEVDEVWNSVVALGSGQGEGVQLTLRDPDAGGDYAIQNFANQDGTLAYYIQDASSVALYDERWKVLTFPQIRPLDNSETARGRAALLLKLAAETFMKRHLAPKVVYQISEVSSLSSDVKSGQTVFVDYRGVVNNYGYQRVRGDFWVLAIRRSRNADGSRSTRLTLASTDAKRKTDADVVIGMQNDIRALGVHVATGPTNVNIGRQLWVKEGDSDTIDIPIGDETQRVLTAILRFKTRVLQSPVESSGSESTTIPVSGGGNTPSGGGSTSGSTAHGHGLQVISGPSPAGTAVFWDPSVGLNSTGGGVDQITIQNDNPAHTHSFPNHGHQTPAHAHPFTAEISTAFGKFSDTVFPADVGVKINGVDQTALLTERISGTTGPWGADSASFEGELVITDLLNDAVGGLQQRHVIEFFCGGSYGWIDVEVTMTNSIQANVVF